MTPTLTLTFLRSVFAKFLWVLALCAVMPSQAATAFVQGEVLYRARVMPPPDAVLIVTLEDVSRADAPSREIASTRMRLSSGPPYAWRIGYDPAVLEGPRHGLRARILVGDKLWMTTDQHYPAFGPDAKKKPTLMLRMVEAAPVGGTPAPVPDASLQNTYWKLTHLGAQPMLPPAGQSAEAHLVLHFEGRVAGSDGCNRMMGRYTLDAERLTFGPLAGTRMACQGLDGRDAAFMRALESVTGWRVQGNTLELLAGTVPVARFAAVALR